MFTFVFRIVVVWFYIHKIVHLSFKKSFTYFVINVNVFFIFMLCRNLRCVIKLKTFSSFKINIIVINFLWSFYIVWIFFVINCRVVFIDWCLRVFIWMFDNFSHVSKTLRKRFDIIDSNILFKLSNNAINLYVFDCE